MLSGLPKRLRSLKHDKFLRSVSVLAGGTAAAQALGLLTLPVLTRFFTPQDFSLLAIYVAILTMMSSVVCMRLDTAIPLPEDDDDATNLLALALTCTVIVTLLSSLIILFIGSEIAVAISRPEIVPYLWLIPCGVGLIGAYSSFQYMAMRQKAFKLIARTKMTQAFLGLGSQVGFGWAGIAPLGLLIGHAVMSGAGVISLAAKTLQGSLGSFSLASLSFLRMRKNLYKYRKFPQYSVIEGLSNNTGIQLPVILIGSFLVGPEAGLLFLAMKAVGTPMTVIGGAVAQVYYSHTAEYARQGTLANETLTVFKRLSRLLVVPMLALGPFAPDVFRIAFGTEWERAGFIVILMLPYYAFRMIASPISTVMYVQMRHALLLSVNVLGLILRVLPLIVVLYLSPSYATIIFAFSSAVFYGGSLVVYLKVAEVNLKSEYQFFLRELLLWVVVIFCSSFVVWGL